MGIFTNKEHFLHQYVTFMESSRIKGKEGGFDRFLNDLGVSIKGQYWNEDHSQIDWNRVENHYQFPFDYEGNEREIETLLKDSILADHEFLYTWLSWDDPIIKIKVIDFIKFWEWFYIASVEGMIVITEDGNHYLEFTDDYKYHLNSNFQIKQNSIK